MAVKDLKERLTDGKITSHQQIPTVSILPDTLTKDMQMHGDMIKLLREGNSELRNAGINRVQCTNKEIMMTNNTGRRLQIER